MKENDYIAEYIKEKYPTLLGLDFRMWKMVIVAVNVSRKIVEAFNSVDSSSDKEGSDNNDT